MKGALALPYGADRYGIAVGAAISRPRRRTASERGGRPRAVPTGKGRRVDAMGRSPNRSAGGERSPGPAKTIPAEPGRKPPGER